MDLLVLDLMLPGVDGLTLCREAAPAHSRVPVLMLSARGEDVDRIVGPRDGRRRLSRQAVPSARAARAHPRDPRPRAAAGPRRRRGRRTTASSGFRLDMVRRDARARGRQRGSRSRARSSSCSRSSSRARNRVLSRDLLVELTQGREAPAYDRSIDVRVSRLRQALGDSGEHAHAADGLRRGLHAQRPRSSIGDATADGAPRPSPPRGWPRERSRGACSSS